MFCDFHSHNNTKYFHDNDIQIGFSSTEILRFVNVTWNVKEKYLQYIK